MPPARSPSIFVGVVVLLGCSSVVFAALCKPVHYWDRRLQRCEPCKKCLAPDLIILRYCEIYSDTVCGPQSRIFEVLSASKDELTHWRHRLNSNPSESSFDQSKRINGSSAAGDSSAAAAAAAAASDAQLSQIFTLACFLIFTVLIFSMMAIICVLQYKQKKECTVLIENEVGGAGGIGLLMGTRQLATRNRLNPTDQFYTLTQIDCTPAMDKILEERRRNVRRYLPHLSTCENVYVDPAEHMSKKAATQPTHRV